VSKVPLTDVTTSDAYGEYSVADGGFSQIRGRPNILLKKSKQGGEGPAFVGRNRRQGI